MVPEVPLEQTEHGLFAAGDGWFVLNMHKARWWYPGHGFEAGIGGEADFSQIGISLRQWDFVHCPPETQHVIVGSGDSPCVVFAVGARERHTFRGPDGRLQGRDDWGAYTVDDAAIRHGAGVEHETTDANEAYAGFPAREPMRYRDEWLPGSHS